MSAPISAIIPTLNAAPDVARCVESLFPGLHEGLIGDLTISDGGSSDNIADLAEELGATFIAGPSGRGGQIARGVAATSRPWLLILHADSVLDSNWTDEVAAFLETDGDKAGFFRVRFRAKGLAPALVAAWARFRARWLDLPYGDQGLLLHRDLLGAVGGVQEIPLMEDVAIARALKGRLTEIPVGISTSAERYERDGWLRRGAQNLGTLARYFAGVDPNTLADRYRR